MLLCTQYKNTSRAELFISNAGLLACPTPCTKRQAVYEPKLKFVSPDSNSFGMPNLHRNKKVPCPSKAVFFFFLPNHVERSLQALVESFPSPTSARIPARIFPAGRTSSPQSSTHAMRWWEWWERWGT
jgi:hypothetical protein